MELHMAAAPCGFESLSHPTDERHEALCSYANWNVMLGLEDSRGEVEDASMDVTRHRLLNLAECRKSEPYTNHNGDKLKSAKSLRAQRRPVHVPDFDGPRLSSQGSASRLQYAMLQASPFRTTCKSAGSSTRRAKIRSVLIA